MGEKRPKNPQKETLAKYHGAHMYVAGVHSSKLT